MKWFKFNSLRKRYAALTLILTIIMVSVSWFAQKQMSTIQKDIRINIESRNSLLQRNREIRNTISQFRDLLAKFQIDPKSFNDQEFVSIIILRAINHIEQLALHPWIKENYSSTISELISTLNDADKTSRKLIKIRLTPQAIFPSLKISNLKMQPLNATFTQNINLAIQDLEDNYTTGNYEEYNLLIKLRYNWTTLISSFRMYLLNQLNSFQESFLTNQLNRITELQQLIKRRLTILKKLS
jgi:hypothetical protein